MDKSTNELNQANTSDMEGKSMLDHLKKSGRWRWLAAGCAAVMLGAFALFSTNGSGNWALLLFLCPVMHIVMHRFMHHAGHGDKVAPKKRPFIALLPAPPDVREPQLPGRDDG